MSYEHCDGPFMTPAIRVGTKNRARRIMAACVDQATSKVIADGWNRSDLDSTWRVAMDAVNHAASAGFGDLSRLDPLTTSEPSPPTDRAEHR